MQELTRKELEVFRLIAQGKMDKEIASELGISVNAVRDRFKRIQRKRGTQNRVEATLSFLFLFTKEEALKRLGDLKRRKRQGSYQK